MLNKNKKKMEKEDIKKKIEKYVETVNVKLSKEEDNIKMSVNESSKSNIDDLISKKLLRMIEKSLKKIYINFDEIDEYVVVNSDNRLLIIDIHKLKIEMNVVGNKIIELKKEISNHKKKDGDINNNVYRDKMSKLNEESKILKKLIVIGRRKIKEKIKINDEEHMIIINNKLKEKANNIELIKEKIKNAKDEYYLKIFDVKSTFSNDNMMRNNIHKLVSECSNLSDDCGKLLLKSYTLIDNKLNKMTKMGEKINQQT